MKKIMKEIIKLAIALEVLMLIISSAGAEPMAMSFGVDDALGYPGTFVKVPVNITDVHHESIAGIIFQISFDTSVINLTKDQVLNGDLTSAWDIPGFNSTNGKISIVLENDTTAIPTGVSGSVVILNFSVVGNSGAKSAINISEIQLSSLEGTIGTASAKNGTFTIQNKTGRGIVSGMKFNDSNGNAAKDPEESGLDNWTIVLKNSTGSRVDALMTDNNGNYIFSGLTAGNYTVEEVIQAGWTQTFPQNPGTYNLILKPGENITEINFGNRKSPITSGVNVIREIEKDSLRKGESTNITVRITSDIIQALALYEKIPEGWNITRISDDSDGFKNRTNEWAWSNVTPGIAKTVIYSITAPDDAIIGTYMINGTLSNSNGVIAIVGGENRITFDIFAYYRRLGNDPARLETTDLLKAMDDWRNGTIPTGFTHPITSQELFDLIDEWAMS